MHTLPDFFPAETIEAIIAHTPHKRTSVFSPLITLQAFIFQVLSDDSSCKLAVAGVLVDRVSPVGRAHAFRARHSDAATGNVGHEKHMPDLS